MWPPSMASEQLQVVPQGRLLSPTEEQTLLLLVVLSKTEVEQFL